MSPLGTAFSTIYEFEGFRLDADKRVLFSPDGSAISLMPKAYETLSYLVENAGRVIEKDELMQAVWPDTAVEENNLNQNISALRKVLGEKRGDHRFIATIPGKGYKFVARVAAPRLGQDSPEGPDAAVSGLTVPRAPSAAWNRSAVFLVVSLVLVIGGLAYFLTRGSEPVAGIKSIAVLPFRPLVQEHRDEILEIGMADTLIARLGTTPDLIVRPISSVRKFAGPNADPQAAGRELSVEAVLEGSIQRWGTSCASTSGCWTFGTGGPYGRERSMSHTPTCSKCRTRSRAESPRH